MKATVISLDGDRYGVTGVDRVAFTNGDTFGTPEIAKLDDGETRVLLVNVFGYTAIDLAK